MRRVSENQSSRPARLATLALMALLGISCGARNGDEVVLVMAASSLSDAFADIEAAFERANPDLDVQLNLAGSSSLREQILQGAPGDVFASANESIMAQVVQASAAATEPLIFATNRLAIAVPTDNPAGVTGLADLGDGDLLVGLCSAGVPCGDFARTALAAAGVEPAPDTNEPDVRALLTKIAAGELDVGVVYATDVIANERTDAIELPAEVNVEVAYPVTRLVDGANGDGAERFIAFVVSEQGQAALRSRGFGSP